MLLRLCMIWPMANSQMLTFEKALMVEAITFLTGAAQAVNDA